MEAIACEGHRVQRCPRCRGHLLTTLSLEAIKRETRKPLEDLKREAATHFSGSTIETVKCPVCLRAMTKQTILRPVEIQVDACSKCSRVWLDGGELAMVQLAFETSVTHKESEEMKRRVAELEANPARKERFERNCSMLDEGPSSVVDVIGKTLGDGVMLALRIVCRV